MSANASANKGNSIFKALNIPTVMIAAGAVLGGTASADLRGNVEFFPATVCILFAVFAQLTANCWHRYNSDCHVMSPYSDKPAQSDFTGAEDTALYYKVGAYAMGLLALMTGSTIIAMGGLWVLAVAVFLGITVWFMVGGKTPLILTPWSPFMSFIIFGPLTVITVCIIQCTHDYPDALSWFDIDPAMYMSAIIGSMAAICNLTANYSSFDFDTAHKRDTFAVACGLRKTRLAIMLLGILFTAVMCVSCFTLKLRVPGAGIATALICFGINLWIWWRLGKATPEENERLQTLAAANVLLMGILTMLIGHFDGIPDESHMRIFTHLT